MSYPHSRLEINLLNDLSLVSSWWPGCRLWAHMGPSQIRFHEGNATTWPGEPLAQLEVLSPRIPFRVPEPIPVAMLHGSGSVFGLRTFAQLP